MKPNESKVEDARKESRSLEKLMLRLQRMQRRSWNGAFGRLLQSLIGALVRPIEDYSDKLREHRELGHAVDENV